MRLPPRRPPPTGGRARRRRARLSACRVRIAWVGPLPPSPSGIGDYSADLLPHVAALAPVTAFTTEPGWAPDRPVPGLTVRPWQELPGALAADPELVPVYQQGNNEHHWFVYDLAMEHPGVLVLH